MIEVVSLRKWKFQLSKDEDGTWRALLHLNQDILNKYCKNEQEQKLPLIKCECYLCSKMEDKESCLISLKMEFVFDERWKLRLIEKGTWSLLDLIDESWRKMLNVISDGI